MAISLVNNLGSLESQTKLGLTSAKLNSTIQRLSSGLRINFSGDDAAGLAIANVYRSDVSKLRQGVRNANDGISTLQIIDGGLNTISNLLDRATTLATQSRSETFTGNRNTLQAEFEKVMGEISRQAEAIGLGGATGTDNGRFNDRLDVYIGGGSTATSANNKVNVDLSNSRVDQAGLGLSNLNIGAASGTLTGNQAVAASSAVETLTLKYADSNGSLTTGTISIEAGLTRSEVVDAINNDADAIAAGITASLDSSDKLVLTSSKFYSLSSTLQNSDATGSGIGAATIGDSRLNNVAYTSAQAVSADGGAASGTQSITFSGDDFSNFTNGFKTVSFSNTATRAASNTNILDAVNSNTTLREAGVYAISTKADDSEVTFISLKKFNVAVSSNTTAADNDLTPSTSTAASTPTTTAGGVDGAEQALSKLKNAVVTLGEVQGKVGSGQNNLSQAIDLALSQITNFQAAESRVRDADVSSEASDLARLSVLQQAGVAALAQANQSNQAVLSLLR